MYRARKWCLSCLGRVDMLFHMSTLCAPHVMRSMCVHGGPYALSRAGTALTSATKSRSARIDTCHTFHRLNGHATLVVDVAAGTEQNPPDRWRHIDGLRTPSVAPTHASATADVRRLSVADAPSLPTMGQRQRCQVDALCRRHRKRLRASDGDALARSGSGIPTLALLVPGRRPHRHRHPAAPRRRGSPRRPRQARLAAAPRRAQHVAGNPAIS